MSSSRRSGRELYEKFFRGYTRKQWGLDPSELDKSVTARVPTRTNRDDRYFGDEYQFMPKHGYTRMFERMLDHPNIHVMTQTDYDDVQDVIPHRRLIFTGPIDEYLRLPLRQAALPLAALQARHARPGNGPAGRRRELSRRPQDYTRITEYKHLTGQEHPKTALTYEYPSAEGDPYYPIPKPENQELFKKYERLALATPERLVRRAACDLPLLQHGPDRGPGARDIPPDQRIAADFRRSRPTVTSIAPAALAS